MSDSNLKGISEVAKIIYNNGGLKNFYSGFTPVSWIIFLKSCRSFRK